MGKESASILQFTSSRFCATLARTSVLCSTITCVLSGHYQKTNLKVYKKIFSGYNFPKIYSNCEATSISHILNMLLPYALSLTLLSAMASA